MAEEVEQEVEAMEAVYGSDCKVLRVLPPHLSILLKPRTADDLCVQFVEALLVIKACPKYPCVPPELELKDAKGLGDSRHAKLLEELQAQARDFSGEPMLVAICEAATDLLTNMNVPEGDCCFCMNPFVMDDGAQPFMKLMSCFHCFHSDCFGNWWRWLQQQRRGSISGAVSDTRSNDEDNDERFEGRSTVLIEDLMVNCPVCRLVVHTEDVAHVRDFLTAEQNSDPVKIKDNDAKVPSEIFTEEELARRARFSAEFEAQQARGAIIEPRKLEVILPGMVVPPRTPQVEEEQQPAPPIPVEDQPSPSVSIDSPVSSFSSSETSRLATIQNESETPKGHPQRENGQGSRETARGRKGTSSSRGSHSGSRGYHGRSRVKKDHGHAAGDSPRQQSNFSRAAPRGSKVDRDTHRRVEAD